MTRRVPRLLLPALMLAGVSVAPHDSERALAQTADVQIPASCPATRASDSSFVPPSPYPSAAPSWNDVWIGAEGLWVMAPADGIWRGVKRSSQHGPVYGNKQFWWSRGYDGTTEPLPELTVSGRRLDGDTPPFVAGPATNAHHADFGGWTMLVAPQIPLGCWEMTGRYRGHSVSFVVWVPSA